MRDLNFHSPEIAFLMMLVSVFFFSQLSLYYYRKKQIQSYADSRLLPKLVRNRSRLASFYKIGAWGVIWILLCFALMSPEGNVRYLSDPSNEVLEAKKTHELIFLVDTSASMGVRDSENKQTRLEKTKTIMQDLIGQLKNTSISIYAMTSTLTPLVPQTLDFLFARLVVREIEINQGEIGGNRIFVSTKKA